MGTLGPLATQIVNRDRIGPETRCSSRSKVDSSPVSTTRSIKQQTNKHILVPDMNRKDMIRNTIRDGEVLKTKIRSCQEAFSSSPPGVYWRPLQGRRLANWFSQIPTPPLTQCYAHPTFVTIFLAKYEDLKESSYLWAIFLMAYTFWQISSGLLQCLSSSIIVEKALQAEICCTFENV